MWKEELMEILFSNDISKINAERAIDLKYLNTPSSLYKYKSFDDKYSLELLNNDKMFLSRPTNFNDPFDCALKLTIKDMPKEYVVRLLEKFDYNYFKQFKISEKEFNKAKKKKDPIHILNKLSVKKNKQDITLKERNKLIEEMDNRIKNYTLDIGHKKNIHVACFSETNKSILMWSHYSNNHEGFCVEYDFKKSGNKNPVTRFIFPVFYTESVFDMSYYLDSYGNGFDNVLKKYMRDINPNDIKEGIKIPKGKYLNNMSIFYNALRKYKDWNYEKEWRYVFPYKNISNKKIYLSVPKPKAVYLGAMVSVQNCKKILKIGKERDIEVYQMKLNPSEFALDSTIIHECNNISNN